MSLSNFVNHELEELPFELLLLAEYENKGNHHIESMNRLTRGGLTTIIKKQFEKSIDKFIPNKRTFDAEDQSIKGFTFKVNFKEIKLSKPSYEQFNSSKVILPLYPTYAMQTGSTYACPMKLNLTAFLEAHYIDGKKANISKDITVDIGMLPCMVGSEMCNTDKLTKECLKKLNENNYKGYFIINGKPWAICLKETLCFNAPNIYKNLYDNEIIRGNFLSKPGDGFENSYQILIKYLNTNAIVITFEQNKASIELPFYILYYIFGITSDEEIFKTIINGTNSIEMIKIVESAFKIDPSHPYKSRKPQDILNTLIYQLYPIKESKMEAKKEYNEEERKFFLNKVMDLLDKVILPHIGQTSNFRPRKLYFIGHLINKILSVKLGILAPSSRDSYKSKRLETAGHAMSKAFKTYFNFNIVMPIIKGVTEGLEDVSFSKINLQGLIGGIISNKASAFATGLAQAITSGNKPMTHAKNNIQSKIMSQLITFKNDMYFISVMNTIETSNPSMSKQNDRAEEMRAIHPTYIGGVCITQSADSGPSVGLTKQMAISASVSSCQDSFILKSILYEDKDLNPKIDEFSHTNNKVFVNGDWIGCCDFSAAFVAKYREKRRNGEINRLTTIYWEILTKEIHFHVDVGRVLRPLIIVYNNLSTYTEGTFSQWIELKHQHLIDLQLGKIDMNYLVEQKIIEYISLEEAENYLYAMDFKTLVTHQHDITHRFTHLDIPQAMFGVVALSSPLKNHSNCVRNTYFTSQRKQSICLPASNYPFIYEKHLTVAHYFETPLVSTLADSLTFPNGQNVIVAIMLRDGTNEEDSLEVCKDSINSGMFNASHFNCEKCELSTDETFGSKDPLRTVSKEGNNYSVLKGITVTRDSLLTKNVVLVQKTQTISRPLDDKKYRDVSLVYKYDEPARVESVIETHSINENHSYNVKWRQNRTLNVGEKLSSRTGNKGIVSVCTSRCRMPYCEDGTTPDIIVNCHSFPTRMAINQIIEGCLANLAAKRGSLIDGTTFTNVNINSTIEELEKYGIKYGGHKTMYNGRTGEKYDVAIFSGINCYQRLQKFCIEQRYAIDIGPTSVLTHQPLQGKNNNGGLKYGEMEKDVSMAHGAMRAFREKCWKHSDGMYMNICRKCGLRAIVNERERGDKKHAHYTCVECGDSAEIVSVPTTWTSGAIFINDLLAIGAEMRFKF